ncbi:MAG: nuclear transport factor 2 family protein [Terracidiphilus sp.]
MKTNTGLNFPLTLLLMAALDVAAAGAQQISPADSAPSQSELDKTTAAPDSTFFDAYNKCDLAKFKSYLADNPEFYHDQQGEILGKDSVADLLKSYVCGKERRDLVPGTLQAYSMAGYGALVMGVHRFYPQGPEASGPVIEEKFIELWQHKDGAWKISRVINYDHRAVSN